MKWFACRLLIIECRLTFAHAGLGYEGAKHLAKNGISLLIFAVRDTTKGENAAKRLKDELPAWAGQTEVWKLDMASFQSVTTFGERINTLPRLDILIANAGVSGRLSITALCDKIHMF